MTYTMYQVDAFADRAFTGNPAAVVILPSFLPDAILLAIAEENNLSETAFVIKQADGLYDLRWFTPQAEVRLCGHATLASAHVVRHHLDDTSPSLRFNTLAGQLVAQAHDGKIMITLPADHPRPVAAIPHIADLLSCAVTQLYRGIDDYIAMVASIDELRDLTPDLRGIASLDSRGLIVTCRDGGTDIACRCFYPALGVDEDPVTGSAHASLIPLWTTIVNTNVFTSRQLSARGGHVDCVYKGDTVALLGGAYTYLEGTISI